MRADPTADGARLAALRELNLLDTQPDAEYDRFTALTTELLGVPVSLITLIDRDRQYFHSSHGLSGVWAEDRQTPLSHSLCRYVVSSGQPVIIDDTRQDPRSADNLAVRDLSVLAYAGMPLTLRDGNVVGALAAVDTEPHAWTERDLRVLADLAAAVRSMLDLRRALAQESLHDALTGLPNRALTVAYGEQLSTVAGAGELLALAIDIDDLGGVNLRYTSGHGDRLINLIARRIAHQLSEDDVLGRLDCDTFLVLRPNLRDQLEALALSDQIRRAVCAEPVTVRGDQLQVTVTTGVATSPAGAGGEAVVERALASLREAKARRQPRAVARLGGSWDTRDARMRAALPGAVRRGEMAVAFQPIVELATGHTRGFEALARWHHPQLGLVGPSAFIPAAEATGDIVLIGEYVLRSACEQLARWRADWPSDELQMTVNVSPLQLAVPNMVDLVSAILRETRLPGSALVLELTEGVFISPGAVQRRNLEAIRELGIQIALDDFGTGYSALSYLKRFPVDVIKVDRVFLDGLETDRRDAALMRAILAIGAGMELEVVAEGVETKAQRELLRLSGCHWGQGFLFSEPLPADQITLPRRIARRNVPRHAAPRLGRLAVAAGD